LYGSFTEESKAKAVAGIARTGGIVRAESAKLREVIEIRENKETKSFPAFALIILLLSAFMDLVDTTIVNIALPSIQKDLNAGASAAQWTVDAYLLGLALFIITGGRLGDIYGRKKMFLIGVAGFTITSALSGFAPTVDVLIAARFLQGAAAAIMVPQVLSFIQVLFLPEERAAAFGAYSAVLGFATVCGPLLSALLISNNILGLTWRPIFLINVPVGIFTLIAAFLLFKESKSEHPLRVDAFGIVLISSALLMLLYPLIQGNNLGWPIWTYISMVAAIVVGGIFVLYEKHRIKKEKSPLVALNLFNFKSFSGGVLVSSLLNLALGGFFLVITFYLQQGLGFAPLQAALTALPFSFMVPVMASLSVMKLAPVFGRKVVTLGAFLFAVGLVGVVFTLQSGGSGLNGWALLPALAVSGAGMGMVVAPILDFALAQVPTQDAGSASGLFSMLNQVGSCIGVAVIGTIFFNRLGSTFAFISFASGAKMATLCAASILLLTVPFTLLLPRKVHQHTENG